MSAFLFSKAGQRKGKGDSKSSGSPFVVSFRHTYLAGEVQVCRWLADLSFVSWAGRVKGKIRHGYKSLVVRVVTATCD